MSDHGVPTQPWEREAWEREVAYWRQAIVAAAARMPSSNDPEKLLESMNGCQARIAYARRRLAEAQEPPAVEPNRPDPNYWNAPEAEPNARVDYYPIEAIRTSYESGFRAGHAFRGTSAPPVTWDQACTAVKAALKGSPSAIDDTARVCEALGKLYNPTLYAAKPTALTETERSVCICMRFPGNNPWCPIHTSRTSTSRGEAS